MTPDAGRPCYFLAHIDIRDVAEYERYLAGFDEVFEGHGGEVVAVDDEVEPLEGS